MKWFFKNQELLDNPNQALSIKERGFMFGDGIFESCKIYNGKIYNFDEHLARIKNGLKALKIKFSTQNLEQQSLLLIRKNQILEGVLRISISRGQGSIGYLPHQAETLLIIETIKASEPLKDRVILGFSDIKTPPASSLPVYCKTMQSMPYILNKIKAQEAGLFDLIMLSQKNFIAETSSANIFWVKENIIFTPAKNCDIVLGTMRAKILKLLNKNPDFKMQEISAKLSILLNAEEVFLTNANRILIPVEAIIYKNKKILFDNKKATKIKEIIWQDISRSCC